MKKANHARILLVYNVCTHVLTAITFLKLNKKSKCPIQINVNECIYEGDPEIRGQVLLNRVAFIECNGNVQI